MKQLLLPLLLLGVSILHSQSKVDSLELASGKATVDSVKIKILHQLFDQYLDNTSTKAKETILEALALSKRTGNKRLLVIGYNRYADFLRTQSMDDSAAVVNGKALKLGKEIKFLKGQSDALLGLGSGFWRKGNFERAREYLEENITLATALDDQTNLANSYMGLAAIHTQSIEYAEAMELYTTASQIYRESGDLRNLSRALGNIGFVQRNVGNFENAKIYLKETDSIARLVNYRSQRAFAAYNLSIVYRKTGELQKAIRSNRKAIGIYEELGDRKRVAFGQFTMGKIYWEMQSFGDALDYYKKSLEISQQVDDSVNIGHSYEEIAKCYHRLRENEKAKDYLLKAQGVAKGIKLDVLAMNTYRTLSEIYAEEGNFEKAYQHKNDYAILRDSLYTKEKIDLASDIEAKYQNEQKIKEIALLESDKELQNLQLNKRINERNGIIAFSIVMLVLAGLLYNQYRIKQRANRKLRELDRLKSNFFANISHEFRTPLTLIKGPIEQLEQNPEKPLSRETVKMIRRNSTRVLKLVNQLLDLSKIDEGNLELQPTEGDMYKCLRALTASFNSHAAQRHIDYRVQIPQTVLWASFDRDKLEKVVFNLLGNAFKFSDDGSIISFEVTYDRQDLQLVVTDSGKGIPEENIPFIFDRFYQVDSGSTKEQDGSGIGLSLSKDLVELMDGTITVSSKLNEGTRFTVQFPLAEIQTRQALSKDKTPVKDAMDLEAFQWTKADGRDLPRILLVEDHNDMRHFIKENLVHGYRINEAVNGEAGLKKAIADPPDLIITDLMMPKLDGIELCKKLKTNVNTSHIPVIMLTAKAGRDNKLEGLETGADDYLTKPFDAKELLVRTKNLIEQRQKLRELYTSAEIQVDPKKVTVTSIDQKFLEQVLDLLEENYPNSDFGVPQMQKALAMSKTQLHRKLKALTNEAPGELLRNFRLKRAAQLLSQKADSVTQIAYKVGFNNLSYFAKCFRELYGVAPSAY